MFTIQALFTIGQVAQLFGISRSRLAYLIEAGYVPQPSASVPGRRLFSTADISKLREVLVNIGEIVPQAAPSMPSHNDGMVA